MPNMVSTGFVHHEHGSSQIIGHSGTKQGCVQGLSTQQIESAAEIKADHQASLAVSTVLAITSFVAWEGIVAY